MIVSNDGLQEDEWGLVYLALISSNVKINPQYAYKLTPEMTTFEFAKQSYVKCQIISGYNDRDVIRKLGSIKRQYFNEIVDKIIETIF